MSTDETRKSARYARSIEHRWSELQGKAIVLSPRDWARIERWYSLGIPLDIVAEAMAAVTERERAGQSPHRLAEVVPLVEEAWAVILDGRRATQCEVGPSPEADPLTLWRRRKEREPAGSPVAALLDELTGRFEGGEDPSGVDEELDRRLVEAVDPALLESVQQEVDTELEPFQGRIPADRLDVTRHRACVVRLRRALDLPRLAIASTEA